MSARGSAAGPETAALRSWRQMAEDSLGVSTPDEVADYIRLSGLSIHLGEYGEWGSQTLACLFAELGLQPGQDMSDAVALIDSLRAKSTLSQRMRDAAETIEELNALCGMGLNSDVTPRYLRAEADRMEEVRQ